MSLIVKDEAKDYPKASEGQHVAVCVDVIGPWEAVDDYDKQKPYPVRKIAYVWQLDERRQDGKPFEVAREFTLTFGQKANLRKFLGAWRGRTIDDAEAKAGVDVAAFKGAPAFLTLEHKRSSTGRLRVNVVSAIPLPKMVPSITATPDYARAPYWAKRMEAETAESRRLAEQLSGVRATEARTAADFSEPPAALGANEDDTDSLSF